MTVQVERSLAATVGVRALDLVNLQRLMDLTTGRAEVAIALIDGPVIKDHPDLAQARISELPASSGSCKQPTSASCAHGTFIAGILVARRGSPAPAICPDCTLLVRPIFAEVSPECGGVPSAVPEELAEAIVSCVHAGARVINLSVALARPSQRAQRELERALDAAAQHGVLVVAAAGNQGMLGSSPITRHPWVLPVVACDRKGRPTDESNLGTSIGRRGLRAPGDEIRSLGHHGPLRLSGTSVAAPFVTGAIAILCSEIRGATGAAIRMAIVTQGYGSRRTSVVPPLLDAWAAYEGLRKAYS